MIEANDPHHKKFRQFRFISGVTVQIFWESYSNLWAGVYKGPPLPDHKFSTSVIVHSADRRDLPGKLRLLVALKNPKFAQTHRKLNPVKRNLYVRWTDTPPSHITINGKEHLVVSAEPV